MRQGVLFSVIVSTIFCAPALAYDWSTNPGDGSEANPYQISTPEQLMSIGSNVDLLDKHFELVNDIVFDPNNNPEHVFDKALIAPNTNGAAGYQGMSFTGTFNGNGYSILNLKIVNGSYYLGMFGLIEGSSNTVSVENLSFVNPIINTGYETGYVGTLCGKLKDGTVKNCHVDSLVISSDRIEARGGSIGGIVGQNENGLIGDCSVCCNFHKIHFSATGGLAGRNTGTIENSTANCTIINETQYYISGGIGGITGINSGNITGCVSKGHIEGPLDIGGVVGSNSGNCLRSFFNGTISCNWTATWDIGCGGFVGNNSGHIQECYAISRIHLKYTVRDVGGFVGYHDGGTVDRCGSWSKIVCEPLCEPSAIGGFLGRCPPDGEISNCYSQGEIQTNNKNIYGLGGFSGGPLPDTTNCYSTVKQIHNQIDILRDYNITSFSIYSYNPFGEQKNFYDIQQSNVINDYDPGSGSSLSTKQMQEKSSFLAAGWDFTGEDGNGTEDIWKIDNGDYPRLAWLPEVSVPDVLKMSLQDAQAKIESTGLTVGDVRYHYSDSVPAGTVTVQSLQAGLEVTYGREINLWVSNGQASPYSGGGEGTKQKPCRIGTAEDLILLGQTQSDYDKCFVLINDVNMAPSTLGREPFFEAVIAPVTLQSRWQNDWYLGGSFRGSLDGNHRCISNLQIKAPDEAKYIGLIGRLYSGSVYDLSLENINYSSSDPTGRIHDSGGLTGMCIGSAVSGCSITGEILTYHEGWYVGGNDLGGLAGSSAYSELANCHVEVNIEGCEGIGGLVGKNYGDISRCSTNVAVFAKGLQSGVGGLTGENYGDIFQCSAQGNIIGSGNNFGVGGLVGKNHGDIFQSYSIGQVNGDLCAGGLVGLNLSGHISSCYSQSAVAGIAGGCLIGLNGSPWSLPNEGVCLITHCYATGKVSSMYPIRGVVGTVFPDSANIIDCYWDIDTVGIDDEIFGTGLTTDQMKQQSSFVDWDFENVWWIDEGNDYPRLRWELNTPPVADAGPNQIAYAFVDGYTEVKLDGTGSNDPDGDALEYYWYNDANELIATGAEPNVVLSVGEHVISLIVSDGIEDSQPDSCVITVIEPFEALAGAVTELVQHKGIANSLLAKLDAARKKIADGNETNDGAAVGSLRAFIHAVSAQRGKKISEADADSLISLAEQIIKML